MDVGFAFVSSDLFPSIDAGILVLFRERIDRDVAFPNDIYIDYCVIKQ